MDSPHAANSGISNGLVQEIPNILLTEAAKNNMPKIWADFGHAVMK